VIQRARPFAAGFRADRGTDLLTAASHALRTPSGIFFERTALFAIVAAIGLVISAAYSWASQVDRCNVGSKTHPASICRAVDTALIQHDCDGPYSST
jgi:hypothetical protein